jgi:hypothetical protein
MRSPRSPWERPDTVVPGSVPGELLLIRTGQVAIAIGSIRAYPDGFEFTVHVRRRTSDETGERHAGDPFNWHPRAYRENALRLGVLYADGRRIATTSGPAGRPDTLEDLVISWRGGGGSDRSWDQEFWLYPLPPDGPVTFIASWTEHGVTETRVELDSAPIREAAGRAVTLWPEDLSPGSGYVGQYSTSTISFTADSTDEEGEASG